MQRIYEHSKSKKSPSTEKFQSGWKIAWSGLSIYHWFWPRQQEWFGCCKFKRTWRNPSAEWAYHIGLAKASSMSHYWVSASILDKEHFLFFGCCSKIGSRGDLDKKAGTFAKCKTWHGRLDHTRVGTRRKKYGNFFVVIYQLHPQIIYMYCMCSWNYIVINKICIIIGFKMISSTFINKKQWKIFFST
jgi:hypothetical protein